MLCALSSIPAGCAGSFPPGIERAIPPSLTAPCPGLTRPEGDLTAEQIWKDWNRDRWSAEVCRSRHAALAAALTGTAETAIP